MEQKFLIFGLFAKLLGVIYTQTGSAR